MLTIDSVLVSRVIPFEALLLEISLLNAKNKYKRSVELDKTKKIYHPFVLFE